MELESRTKCLHCDKDLSYNPALLDSEKSFIFLCRRCFALYDGGILTLKSLRRAQEQELRIAELAEKGESLQRDLDGLARAQQEMDTVLIENGLA